MQSRILDVLVDLGKPPAVGILGPGIEKDTGIPPTERFQFRIRRPGKTFGPGHPTCYEVEGVELPTRLREELRKVVQALQITQGNGVLSSNERDQ